MANAEISGKRLLALATYVVTLCAITVWAFPFGTAIWGFLTEPLAKHHGWSWVFVAYPLCGLWLSAAGPFALREAGRPGFAVVTGIALIFLGLMTVLILQ